MGISGDRREQPGGVGRGESREWGVGSRRSGIGSVQGRGGDCFIEPHEQLGTWIVVQQEEGLVHTEIGNTPCEGAGGRRRRRDREQQGRDTRIAAPPSHELLRAARAVGGEGERSVRLVLVGEARVGEVGDQRRLPLDARVRDLAHLVGVEARPLAPVELLVEGEDGLGVGEVDEGVADVAAAERSGAVRRVSGVGEGARGGRRGRAGAAGGGARTGS